MFYHSALQFHGVTAVSGVATCRMGSLRLFSDPLGYPMPYASAEIDVERNVRDFPCHSAKIGKVY